MDQKKFTATGFLRVFNATGYSFKGIKRAWKTEAAVRQEFLLAAVLLPLAFVLAQSLAQVVIMIMQVPLSSRCEQAMSMAPCIGLLVCLNRAKTRVSFSGGC